MSSPGLGRFVLTRDYRLIAVGKHTCTVVAFVLFHDRSE